MQLQTSILVSPDSVSAVNSPVLKEMDIALRKSTIIRLDEKQDNFDVNNENERPAMDTMVAMVESLTCSVGAAEEKRSEQEKQEECALNGQVSDAAALEAAGSIDAIQCSIDDSSRVATGVVDATATATAANADAATTVVHTLQPLTGIQDRESGLSWTFRNGRLVFEASAPIESDSKSVQITADRSTVTSASGGEVQQCELARNHAIRCTLSNKNHLENGIGDDDTENGDCVLLSSRKLNRRGDGDRLRIIEQKLKQAAAGRSPPAASSMDVVDSSTAASRGSAVTGPEIRQSSLRSSLKPALRKSSSATTSVTSSTTTTTTTAAAPHRVVFNETKNEFFEADYIILIREDFDDYDLDDEDDDDDEDVGDEEQDDDEEVGECGGMGEQLEDDDEECTCHEVQRRRPQLRHCFCEHPHECAPNVREPQSPKYAPPVEFVDTVTLSPPEGYKDMGLLQHYDHKMNLVCAECVATQDDDEERSSVHGNADGATDFDITNGANDREEKEKTDQSQQTTPTTPPGEPCRSSQREDSKEDMEMLPLSNRQSISDRMPIVSSIPRTTTTSPISGILKGGKLWKQTTASDCVTTHSSQLCDNHQLHNNVAESDDDSSCGGSSSSGATMGRRSVRFEDGNMNVTDGCNNNLKYNEDSEPVRSSTKTATHPSATEMMLTYKLGNHSIIANNSLKPNSAVRQLFPCTATTNGPTTTQCGNSTDTGNINNSNSSLTTDSLGTLEADESIRKAIERNTLRRSLIRYEPMKKNKAAAANKENSLVERIKQLTCDVDDNIDTPAEDQRTSPPSQDDIYGSTKVELGPVSDGSSNEKSKAYDINENLKAAITVSINSATSIRPISNNGVSGASNQLNSTSTLVDKQEGFRAAGDRASFASSEYSLEDIDEALQLTNGIPEDVNAHRAVAPDVLAGTPSNSGDELALFVQQDAGRIERLRKKYQPKGGSLAGGTDSGDDEHDDYGFNRRPSVRGIKPRFGSTTEILQQLQSQIQPMPPHQTVTSTQAISNNRCWPYYSESGLDKPRPAAPPTSYHYHQHAHTLHHHHHHPPPPPPHSQPPASSHDLYAPICCRPVSGTLPPSPHISDSALMRSAVSSGRPQSPPPLDIAKSYHQTMVYVPYNPSLGPPPAHYFASSPAPTPHYMHKSATLGGRHSMPPQMYASNRSTQTATMCNVYHHHMHSPAATATLSHPHRTHAHTTHPHYAHQHRVWPANQRHSYPVAPPPNGYVMPPLLPAVHQSSQQGSPTKVGGRFMDRGVPEGAATSSSSCSTSPPDSTASITYNMQPPHATPPLQNSNPPAKSMFYAMNV